MKVQRPGLQKLFDIDLKPLKRLAAQLDAQEEGRDFSGIYNECATILQKEIDYICEGRNANRHDLMNLLFSHVMAMKP